MGNCKDCKFWKKSLRQWNEKVCTRVGDMHNETTPESSFWIASPQAWPEEELSTGPLFGCVQFERKE
jgi:hypothetical protein